MTLFDGTLELIAESFVTWMTVIKIDVNMPFYLCIIVYILCSLSQSEVNIYVTYALENSIIGVRFFSKFFSLIELHDSWSHFIISGPELKTVSPPYTIIMSL